MKTRKRQNRRMIQVKYKGNIWGKMYIYAYCLRRKHSSYFTGATTKHVWHNKIQQRHEF